MTQILKWLTNSCFLNNYFCERFLGVESKHNIQPVFNDYNVMADVWSYWSKAEDIYSNMLNHVAEKTFLKNWLSYI